jgi:uncharacterized protein involved in exopolysaccharide biosynthesis
LETLPFTELEPPRRALDDRPVELEVSLPGILSTLRQEKRRMVWPVLCAALVATVIAFIIPVKYTAEAVILTPQQAQSSLSIMAQMAGIPNFAGLSLLSGLGTHNSSELYVGILESRTIADALVRRFKLKQVYKLKEFQLARKLLARNTTIKAGKDTLIHIKVQDRDPNRAAQLANAYVEELSLRNANVALTEASQRRMFFEKQLAKEKDLLADAEVKLRDTEQVTGLVVPSGQAEALIRSVSQLRAEILSKQAQLAGLQTFVADENPRFQAIKREVATLQSQLAAIEQGEHAPGSPEVPVGKIPQAGLEYIRKYRDVKYHEALFEGLSKQYEAARLDEARAGGLVQVIDEAVIPERKSWPPRTLIVIMSVLLAAICSALWILTENKRVSD